MKRIVEINSVNFSSTGNIMLNIAETAREHEYEVFTFHPSGRSQRKDIEGDYAFGNRYERIVSSRFNFFTGKQGRGNILGTFGLLRRIRAIEPSIIHLHNLHSDYVNISMLIRYIRKHKIRIVWTLHDCWAFTGRCPYFDILGCNQWKTGCDDCRYPKCEYPTSFMNKSHAMWKTKKKMFTCIPNMTIITPSQWLADLVNESFLKQYPIFVINNGIDLSVFKPTESDFRVIHNISKDTFIILGVAFGWGERKGLDRIIRLSKILDQRYKIVLVGTNEKIDKELPVNILSIHRTQDQRQLAEIYSAADVFLNPTREDNFPTVNIEALACGTPVLSYGAGGSAEAFDDTCGKIVSDNTIIEVLESLYVKNYDTRACLNRAKKYDLANLFLEYVSLYNSILS